MFDVYAKEIAVLALKYRLPSIGVFNGFAKSSGLMSYGPDLRALFAQSANYVDRIFKGAAAAYVPELDGTEYGRTSLRHLLQMSSGVRFNEDLPRDYISQDLLQFVLDTFMRVGPGGVSAVTSFNDRERPAGSKFAYSSAETYVLGLALTRAIGRPIAAYLEQKIWQPIGAEADATWLVDNSGQEVTACCLNAVLRDYARLGLLLAHDGNWRGRQIIPAAWVLEATSVHVDQPHVWPGTATAREGYGYQTWILPSERRCSCSGALRGSGSMLIRGASSSW